MSAGKGPHLRKGANMPKFRENYDAIFGNGIELMKLREAQRTKRGTRKK